MPPLTPESILQIPLDKIQPSPYQARKQFDPASIKSLADSMLQEGLIQPITVRQISNSAYELISGERRLRAAKLLGWAAIPARVIEVVSEAAAAAKGLVENLQREDLDPIEEAEGFAAGELDPVFWTHERIAQVCGKGRTYITQSLGMLELPPEVIANVRRRTLSRSHALEILPLSLDAQKQIGREISGKGLSIKETRQRIAALVTGVGRKNRGSAPKSLKDPFEAVWELTKGLNIAVNYKTDGWHIWIKPQGPEAMAQCLDKLAAAVKGAAGITAPGSNTPSLPAPRLPTNPQEQLEVETLAPQGPAAVYAWIFGKDHFWVWQMRNAQWPEGKTPVDACRDLLASFRKGVRF